MNQMVLVLFSEAIQLCAERDLKLIRSSAIISPYLAELIRHNKSNAAFLHDIVIFSPFYLSDATFVISSFKLGPELQKLISDAMIIP